MSHGTRYTAYSIQIVKKIFSFTIFCINFKKALTLTRHACPDSDGNGKFKSGSLVDWAPSTQKDTKNICSNKHECFF